MTLGFLGDYCLVLVICSYRVLVRVAVGVMFGGFGIVYFSLGNSLCSGVRWLLVRWLVFEFFSTFVLG